jgi:hypothetical protein
MKVNLFTPCSNTHTFKTWARNMRNMVYDTLFFKIVNIYFTKLLLLLFDMKFTDKELFIACIVDSI